MVAKFDQKSWGQEDAGPGQRTERVCVRVGLEECGQLPLRLRLGLHHLQEKLDIENGLILVDGTLHVILLNPIDYAISMCSSVSAT